MILNENDDTLSPTAAYLPLSASAEQGSWSEDRATSVQWHNPESCPPL